MSKKPIISLISLLMSGFLVYLFIIPQWSSVKTLRKEVNDKKQEIAKIEELLIKTQQLQEEYQAVEEEATKIFLALPEQADLPHLLVQFEALASSNGLLLEGISFSQTGQESQGGSQGGTRPLGQSEAGAGQTSKKISGFPSLAVNVSLSGSYPAFKTYLSALEKSVRSIDVQSIDFGLGQEGQETETLTGSDIFNFELVVNVYYQ
jgi:hypothetical protein